MSENTENGWDEAEALSEHQKEGSLNRSSNRGRKFERETDLQSNPQMFSNLFNLGKGVWMYW